MKIRSLLLTLLAAGILSAQPAKPAHGQHHGKMMQELNLTADQQTQVRAIFKDQRAQTKDLVQKLRDERTAMAAAVKSGATDQIDKIAQDSAQIRAQLTAARAKSMAKVYTLLNPDQKAKFDARLDARQTRHSKS
jgi:Spy/CpxP family protein refolding chaperone